MCHVRCSTRRLLHHAAGLDSRLDSSTVVRASAKLCFVRALASAEVTVVFKAMRESSSQTKTTGYAKVAESENQEASRFAYADVCGFVCGLHRMVRPRSCMAVACHRWQLMLEVTSTGKGRRPTVRSITLSCCEC